VGQADLAGVVAEAASKILTPYGEYRKNFKFLKEVKILSEFLPNKLVCPIQFMSAEATPRKVHACLQKDLEFSTVDKSLASVLNLTLWRSFSRQAS